MWVVGGNLLACRYHRPKAIAVLSATREKSSNGVTLAVLILFGQLVERSVILVLSITVIAGAPGMSGVAARAFATDDSGEAADGRPERSVK